MAISVVRADVDTDADITSWASVTRASGFDTFATTPTSANLRALVTDESGSGALLFANGALGTPSSGVLTNATGLPISTGVAGLGTGVATALAVNVGSAGAPVVNGGALGTPSSGTLTNATGLPVATGISGLGTGQADALAQPTTIFTLEQYGGGTGVASNHTAFDLAQTAAALVPNPELRLGRGRYAFTQKPSRVTVPWRIRGAGFGLSSLCRNYTPSGGASSDEAFIQANASYATWTDFDISCGDGTVGGRLLEIVLAASPSAIYGNWQLYRSVRFVADIIGGSTFNGTCKQEIHLNGENSSALSAPGLRDIEFQNCWAGFVGQTNSLYAKSVRQFGWLGGYLLGAVAVEDGVRTADSADINSTNVGLHPVTGGVLTAEANATDGLYCSGHWGGGTIGGGVTGGAMIAGPDWTISSTAFFFHGGAKGIQPGDFFVGDDLDVGGDLTLAGAIYSSSLSVYIAGALAAVFSNFGGTPVNYLSFAPNTAGNPVQILANGSDSNVGIRIIPKGTGNTNCATGDFQVGYTTVVDASRGHRLRAYTDTELNDIAHAVNTTDKAIGKEVFNSTQDRSVIAKAATAAGVWVSEGATRNTPI